MARPTPATLQPPQWGLVDAVVGLVIANLAALIVGSAVIAAGDYDIEAPTGPGAYVGRVGIQTALGEPPTEPGLPLAVTAALVVPLWLGFLGVPWFAAHFRGNGMVADFGLRFRRWDPVIGIPAGALTQIVLLPLVYIPIFILFGDDLDLSGPARDLTDKANDPLGIALLVVIVLVGAPIFEEIFFRGLLFRSIDNRWGRPAAIWGSSLVFGVVHWQLLQLPALIVVGLVLAWLVHRFDRLGPAIWAHVAFNAVTVVGLLVL